MRLDRAIVPHMLASLLADYDAIKARIAKHRSLPILHIQEQS